MQASVTKPKCASMKVVKTVSTKTTSVKQTGSSTAFLKQRREWTLNDAKPKTDELALISFATMSVKEDDVVTYAPHKVEWGARKVSFA